MAFWQFVGLSAVVLGAVAGAQESTLAATTLANNPPGAFVYVPSTAIEGQVTVKLSLYCSVTHALLSSLTALARHVLHNCMTRTAKSGN